MTELLTSPNGVAPVAAAAAQGPPTNGIKDFSRKRKRLVFTIDGEQFEAAHVLPGDIYAEMVAKYGGLDEVTGFQDQRGLLKDALELALLPESYERFAARLKDRTNPIEDDQMAEVVMWLVEEYGLRPTPPSQPSSDGPASPDAGTNSTANPLPVESISLPSQPTDS